MHKWVVKFIFPVLVSCLILDPSIAYVSTAGSEILSTRDFGLSGLLLRDFQDEALQLPTLKAASTATRVVAELRLQKEIPTILPNFRFSFLHVLILLRLKQSPTFALDLENQIKPPKGMVRRILNRLVEEKWVRFKWEEVRSTVREGRGRPPRRIFALTSSGGRVLEALLNKLGVGDPAGPEFANPRIGTAKVTARFDNPNFAELLVLSAITDGYLYGTAIMHQTGLASGAVFPILERLSKEGRVRSRLEWRGRARSRKERRPPRRIYELRPKGAQYLSAIMDKIQKFAPAFIASKRKLWQWAKQYLSSDSIKGLPFGSLPKGVRILTEIVMIARKPGIRTIQDGILIDDMISSKTLIGKLTDTLLMVERGCKQCPAIIIRGVRNGQEVLTTIHVDASPVFFRQIRLWFASYRRGLKDIDMFIFTPMWVALPRPMPADGDYLFHNLIYDLQAEPGVSTQIHPLHAVLNQESEEYDDAAFSTSFLANRVGVSLATLGPRNSLKDVRYRQFLWQDFFGRPTKAVASKLKNTDRSRRAA
jgi:DNA-binding PadR family transcriptional regulator